jgi:hypothetical protein
MRKRSLGFAPTPLPFALSLVTIMFFALCSMLLAFCFPVEAQHAGKNSSDRCYIQ